MTFKSILEQDVLHQHLSRETYKALYNAIRYRMLYCDYYSSVKQLKAKDFEITYDEKCDCFFMHITGFSFHYINLKYIPGIKTNCLSKEKKEKYY